MKTSLYEKPIKIELDGSQLFVNGTEHARSVRTAKNMLKVTMDQLTIDDFVSQEIYYMYN